MGKRSIRSHIPGEGEGLSPGLTPGANQLSSLPVFAAFSTKDNMLCFQPEEAKEQQPFKNKNSLAVCFLLEHNENRLRT